jgi:hypothetical protein
MKVKTNLKAGQQINLQNNQQGNNNFSQDNDQSVTMA